MRISEAGVYRPVEASFDGGETWQPAELLISAGSSHDPYGWLLLDQFLLRWGLYREAGGKGGTDDA